jgi:hypothetical protein
LLGARTLEGLNLAVDPKRKKVSGGWAAVGCNGQAKQVRKLMRFTKYSKWTGQDWDDISLEELMDALSEFLLQSGFQDQFRRRSNRWQDWEEEDEFSNFDPEDALKALRDAIREALKNSGLLDQEQYNQLFDDDGNARNEQLEQLIDRLIQRLLQEGYLNALGDPDELEALFGNDAAKRAQSRNQQQQGETDAYRKPNIKFEVTDKGIDFLGYKTLKNLMASFGKVGAWVGTTPIIFQRAWKPTRHQSPTSSATRSTWTSRARCSTRLGARAWACR